VHRALELTAERRCQARRRLNHPTVLQPEKQSFVSLSNSQPAWTRKK
jgi:hypothetical protein